VILITTKKGKAGKTDFNLSVNSGFNSDAKKTEAAEHAAIYSAADGCPGCGWAYTQATTRPIRVMHRM